MAEPMNPIFNVFSIIKAAREMPLGRYIVDVLFLADIPRPSDHSHFNLRNLPFSSHFGFSYCYLCVFKAGQDLSGQNAETVVRKKIVKRGKPESTEEQKELKKKIEQKYQLWNKGVKQHEMRTVKLQEMAKEIDKPLARYRDDADLESFLKVLFAPILCGRLIRISSLELPKYTGPLPPPNRFGILPGFRWDGLDRSNGFEDKLLSQKNLRKAEEEEYYKWSSGNYE
ncbi:unnamed protein product [Soboliphyme baturini]|uniref:BUD13 homolog n=1 Tax=Soboliphyme baturini TaxID=241478 RepID=A0A183IG44_9BILA|nr:unnamed protein product [Soboliphyme baturini]